MNAPQADESYEQLMNVFRKMDRRGGYEYSDEDVRKYLVCVVLTRGVAIDGLSPQLQLLLAETLTEAGARPNMSAAELSSVVRSYYRIHPVNPELDREFSTALCRVAGWGVDQSATRAVFDRLLGRPPARVERSDRPTGVRLSDLAPPRKLIHGR